MSRAETMQLVKRLRKAGFEVERTGSGHWKVSKGNGPFVTLGFSPRGNGLHKSIKRLREIGFEG